MVVERVDNFIVRKWLETLQDIVGENGLKSILNYAHLQAYIGNFPPDTDEVAVPTAHLQLLYKAILELFGQKGAYSLQFNVGKKVMQKMIGGRPMVTVPLKAAARLLPESTRIRMALETFQEQSLKRRTSNLGRERFELHEEEEYFVYVDRDYEGSEGIISNNPSCGFLVGMLYYSVEWITGNPHKVEEIECKSMGHPAEVIRVWKKPEKS